MVTSLIVLEVKGDNRSLLQSTCMSLTLVIFDISQEEFLKRYYSIQRT